MALKRMEWDLLLEPYRFNKEGDVFKPTVEPGRSPFSKDQDKIVFSSSFRRMSKKTQVHPMVNNDHIHTRLTHSVEVGSVGRSLGNIVGAKIVEADAQASFPSHYVGEIVQAACLAHDIGNPPFGHAGESAIQDWVSGKHSQLLSKVANDGKLTTHQLMDLKAFDGNAMGFRILTQLEYDSFKGGMRLSFPTLAAMLKYPWKSTHTEEIKKNKFSCLYPEVDIMNQICLKLGMLKRGDDRWARHPLAYLVEAADDICYNFLDLEDAREMRIVTLKEIRNVCDPLHTDDSKYLTYLDKENISDRRKIAYMRGKTIQVLINCVVETFMENYEAIMSGCFEGSLVDASCKKCKEAVDNADTLCKNKVFKHHRKIELEIGAYNAIGQMMDAFFLAAKELHECSGEFRSFKSERVLDLLGVKQPKKGQNLYEILLPFIDYLSGMTDNFATHISQQIQGQAVPDVTR
ncbi:deoxyguanosinetriphosphate triphosphohydrolase [Pseudodesulfovibrio sp. zrk46]|uniref:deoxyguanosinetriphosphate triphosphohydrolase n=1 Tax=Pseudodesulfovibrio sp. zrk46 TaxID=2725288 RepID=UPI001448B439|nr:deoxyguanosinetriphosphate triphosphohydrolase [Pseudodesulfovibrio sp. zrk46]QJB56035.1 deoxyguanosinetriphosphate triphosphohydrolase [Pseudodesulfovibrio sp. zrk46]